MLQICNRPSTLRFLWVWCIIFSTGMELKVTSAVKSSSRPHIMLCVTYNGLIVSHHAQGILVECGFFWWNKDKPLGLRWDSVLQKKAQWRIWTTECGCTTQAQRWKHHGVGMHHILWFWLPCLDCWEYDRIRILWYFGWQPPRDLKWPGIGAFRNCLPTWQWPKTHIKSCKGMVSGSQHWCIALAGQFTGYEPHWECLGPS